MENQLQVITSKQNTLTVFSNAENFETAQRMANALATSEIVPSNYRGKVANCLVALEISQRTGASIMAVMQSLHIIEGRPSWSSSYIIASVNASGRFEPLRFKVEGKGSAMKCVAWTRDLDGNLCEGPEVTMEMARAEGWLGRKGSKWQTMPELMIRYRAAAFFGRLYAPEILLGMQTQEEVQDTIAVVDGVEVQGPAAGGANEKIKARAAAAKKSAAPPKEAPAPAHAEIVVPEPAPEPVVVPKSASPKPDNKEFSL